MGKGLNRANKQADLRRKMELAKQQNRENAGTKQEKKKYELSDDEIKERNDRLRFEELLKGSTSSAFSDYSSDGYQNKAQEEQDSILQRTYRYKSNVSCDNDEDDIFCGTFTILCRFRFQTHLTTPSVAVVIPFLFFLFAIGFSKSDKIQAKV